MDYKSIDLRTLVFFLLSDAMRFRVASRTTFMLYAVLPMGKVISAKLRKTFVIRWTAIISINYKKYKI